MAKQSQVISARLRKERVKQIEEIAKEEKVDKSSILERALEQYTKEWALRKALELYGSGKVTLSRAAEIAGLSIWEIIEALDKRKTILQYDVEDFEEDMKTIGRA